MVGETGGAGDDRLDQSRIRTAVTAAAPPPQTIRVRAGGESERRTVVLDLAGTSVEYGRPAPEARAREAGAGRGPGATRQTTSRSTCGSFGVTSMSPSPTTTFTSLRTPASFFFKAPATTEKPTPGIRSRSS